MVTAHVAGRPYRIGLLWLGCNSLALAVFLPLADLLGQSPGSLLLLTALVIVAQAACLRRFCRWWLWIPASCLGAYASGYFGAYVWVIAYGCTMSLAQGLCLLPWSWRMAAFWALFGSLGWYVGAMAPSVLNEVHALFGLALPSMAAACASVFWVQSIVLLPAVIMLDKAAVRRAQRPSG